jgi:RNA polymerase sigma-70 factor (ECF subfamily)
MPSLISTSRVSSVHRSRPPSHASLDWAREAHLLGRIRVGDHRAFEALVHQYGPRMLAVARRLLRSEEDSADAVQDAFLAAHRSIASFAGNSRLWTWLYRILVNISLKKMYSRSRRREVPLENVFAASAQPGRHAPLTTQWNETADACAARAETQTQVRACINCLPEAYRTILLVRDIQELDTDEAALLLHLSPGAVKSRLHRARQALKSLLLPIVGFEEAGQDEFRLQSGSFGNTCPDQRVYAAEGDRNRLDSRQPR